MWIKSSIRSTPYSASEQCQTRDDISRLVWLATLIGLFASLVSLLSLYHGVTLPLPTEKISPALGFNAMLPVLITVTGYLGIRAWQFVRMDSATLPILRHWLWTDLGYLALFVVATYFHFVLKLQIPLLRQFHYDSFFFCNRPVLPSIHHHANKAAKRDCPMLAPVE